MNVRMGLIRKKADWTQEDFDAHWRDRHGPLAARVPGLRAYWQNTVVERLQRGIDFPRGPWDFDGFSQLWLDDASNPTRPFAEGETAARLVADEQHFLGDLHIVGAQTAVVIAPPAPAVRARLLKRMSILERLPGLDAEDFSREWQRHGELVRGMPGVSGYRQNTVVARERTKGQPCGRGELPIDGIVELWFENTATLQAAFASPAGRDTMAHARTFLGEITAFLVTERAILP